MTAQRRRRAPSRERLCFYDERVLERQREGWLAGEARLKRLVGELLEAAEEARAAPVPSLLDKTGCAPSGDPRDYWEPAPYWWPDPRRPDGLPYVRRDGVARPESRLYSAESRAYDPSSRQRFFDGLTLLALAWYFTRERRFAQQAAKLARTWFVAPRSRMNPHLRYAQVRMGHGEEGTGPGIVAFRDLAHVLDALRLVARSGELRAGEAAAVRAWFAQFLAWLRSSPQGREAQAHRNNIGTCYELVATAVALYVGEQRFARARLAAARRRIAVQLTPEGGQPLEAARTRPLHYALFNLHLWASLARLARSLGAALWRFDAGAGRSLAKALTALQARARRDRSLQASDRARLRVVTAFAAPGTAPSTRAPMRPHPGAGAAPFWRCGL